MRVARDPKPVASRAVRRAVWLGAGWTALVAGLLTVLAGWSVLGGVRDVGHAVFLPLLPPAMPAAPDSQAAMILRTGLWLAIAAALFWSFQPARE
jgi:hypothetical protein